MQLLYVIGTGVLAAFCVLLAVRICYQRRYIRTSDRINDCIFRNVAAYLLLIDPDFNVLQTNYRSATGTAPQAVPPKVGNLLRCRNGEDAGVCGTHELCADCPVRAAITGVFRTKKGFSELEVPMVLYTSDDRTATVDCDVSVAGNFLTVAGQPRVVLTVSDISAQKRTQRELEKARVRAEESDRMKSRFLANMSHELRTPLNAIIGFSELLMDDPAPTEKQEYMRIIRSNGEVLMQQLSDILDLSKIEAGTLGYEYTDVELNAVMEELEGGFRMRQPKNSPVRITFHRKYPVRYIRTDRKRLIQVIANFLSNAMKFTSEGSVDFGFEIRGGELYVYVADTGAGIPEEHREQLFQRFVKAGSFRQGIGIGLAISKSIVETMGGRIGVMVELSCPEVNDEVKALSHDLVMHIAAANPQFVRRDEVPTDNLEKEREVLTQQALNEGKPAKIVERMVEGRIEKYYKEVCLLEQPFVKDPDINVTKMLGGKADVVRFVRFERGEGLEKRQDNLAADIAAEQAKMKK